jgi:DNA primase
MKDELTERWFKPVIKTPTGTYTKFDIYKYYQSVKDKIFNDIKNHPVIIIRHLEPSYPFLQRNISTDGDKIKITKNTGDVFDKSDISYWIERRTTEFHKTQPEMTDKIIIDIDPNGPVRRSKINETVRLVTAIVKKYPDVTNVEVRYSGGRGFYIIGHLKTKKSVDKLRSELKEALSLIVDNVRTLSVPLPGQIRIDLAPMKRGGSIRALYSINSETGLVSVPVPLNRIEEFDPIKHAKPELFLKKDIPMPVRK